METTKLPQEILIEIFSRLPVKSVGQCRCLAKQWRTLLSSEQFIKSHLIRKPHEESLVLSNQSRSIDCISIIKADAVSRNLGLGDGWAWTEGSCDGLILLVKWEEQKLFAVNPITLQQKEIPDSPMVLKKRENYYNMYGIGYDSSMDDYKIVKLSYYEADYDTDDDEYNPDCVDTFVDVYSLKRGVWKRVGNSPYDHSVTQPCSGGLSNGALHWLASTGESGRYVIAAFDLVHEVFTEVPFPSSLTMDDFTLGDLVVLGGCLCIINVARRDIWFMKEYGVAESWTKFGISVKHGCDILKPLCFTGDGEVVFLTGRGILYVYNLNEGTWKVMFVDGVQAVFAAGCSFVGSLISPDFSGMTIG